MCYIKDMKTNNQKDNFDQISKAFDREEKSEKKEEGKNKKTTNKSSGKNWEEIKNGGVKIKEDQNREGRKLERKNENIKTDWGNVSKSYDKYLVSDGSYHADVIMPNLFRMIGKVTDEKNKNSLSILDIACGQGQIVSELHKLGAKAEGFDYGIDLIKIAKENTKKDNSNISYLVADAQNFADNYFDKKENKYKTFDIITCVLAIQNIENIKLVLENIKKVTNKNSKVYLVINHPAYRIPKHTEWGYTQEGSGDKNTSIQYRRVDKYMSEEKIKMDMNPSVKIEASKEYTYSYHRPMQYYFKLFSNNNFAVTRLEEWISNRVSDGKHEDRENIARREFPMFMCLEIKNI